ncbi:hypothetical protein CG710_008345 [Lachnotalea glycerini]|uniref:Uncharacterized protein n=1 Tax=Lachnotalea glycerini TaxID=1763509 RepID=A0A371JG52_9FIRM|nr:hypothetical protein CG710_008345 [Lachnotalea glycerini]
MILTYTIKPNIYGGIISRYKNVNMIVILQVWDLYFILKIKNLVVLIQICIEKSQNSFTEVLYQKRKLMY